MSDETAGPAAADPGQGAAPAAPVAELATPTVDVRPASGPPTADEILNALFLDLAQDPEIADYLGYVVVPIQMVPAAKTVEYIERVIAAFRRAKGET